MGLHNLFN